MKKYFHSVIKFAIRKARKSKLLQSLFEAPLDLDKFPAFGVFRDSYGHVYELKRGLRDQIKPGWQLALAKPETAPLVESIPQMIESARIDVDKLEAIINAFGKKILDSHILEIGCHFGVNTFTFAEKGAELVTGTDYYEYKVESADVAKITTGNLVDVRGWVERTRALLAKNFSKSGNVRFVNDDICATGLPENTFDIVCSWDVLEHLHDPAAALRNIATVLKPGGLCIHDYNPFFGLNGGHSLCTLDFLWGHVRLNETDFIRYLDEIRPDEKNLAWPFYTKGLNRMTVSDLKDFSRAAGLETLALLTFSKEQHIRMLDEEILGQCRNIYPHVTYIDLVTPCIILVQRKGIN
jgi:SAM-dependent methyltransferase